MHIHVEQGSISLVSGRVVPVDIDRTVFGKDLDSIFLLVIERNMDSEGLEEVDLLLRTCGSDNLQVGVK